MADEQTQVDGPSRPERHEEPLNIAVLRERLQREFPGINNETVWAAVYDAYARVGDELWNDELAPCNETGVAYMVGVTIPELLRIRVTSEYRRVTGVLAQEIASDPLRFLTSAIAAANRAANPGASSSDLDSYLRMLDRLAPFAPRKEVIDDFAGMSDDLIIDVVKGVLEARGWQVTLIPPPPSPDSSDSAD